MSTSLSSVCRFFNEASRRRLKDTHAIYLPCAVDEDKRLAETLRF